MTGRIEQSTHTPGDWKWFNYQDGRKLLAAPSRAVIHCADSPITCDLADQILIAAAPALLVAAKKADAAFDEILTVLRRALATGGTRFNTADMIAAIEQFRPPITEAIAKAEAPI